MSDVHFRYGPFEKGGTQLELVVDGETVETFDVHPKLSALRKAQRELAPDLDLYDADLRCPGCGATISEETRFAAYNDQVLCKSCADIQTTESPAGSDLTVTHDPTKSPLGMSELHHKRLMDWNVNIATGCSHSCSFCYVPATPQIRTQQDRLEENAGVEDSAAEWGDYVLYRDDAPERLRRLLEQKARGDFEGWERTEEGRGIVGMSFHTDCYQSPRAADITHACVRELIDHDRYVRILTRSPNVLRDVDLFQDAGDNVTVGMSIPCLDDAALRAIETKAPPPSARLDALRELADAGVNVYVSMGPTLPTQDREDLRELLQELATLDPGVIFHEPLNPRGPNFERTVAAARDRGQEDLAEEIALLEDKRTWRQYAVEQLRWVHELGRDMELPVYCWPTKELTSGAYADYAEWWRGQESPEPFGGRDPEWEVPPPVPTCAPRERTSLSDFGGETA
jgi:DNA repair photolyase